MGAIDGAKRRSIATRRGCGPGATVSYRCSEQTRLKTATQSHGATARDRATLDGPPANRSTQETTVRRDSLDKSQRRLVTSVEVIQTPSTTRKHMPFTFKLAKRLAIIYGVVGRNIFGFLVVARAHLVNLLVVARRRFFDLLVLLCVVLLRI